jgi:hypothetical protein
VRRRNHNRAALAEMLDDRRGECAAFVRIGTGADLIQQHECRHFELPIHRHQVANM